MLTFTYPAVLHPDEDGAWWAEVPDLPGCLSCGDTFEECRTMIADAMAGWLYATMVMRRPHDPPSDMSRIDGGGDPVLLVTASFTDADIENLRRDRRLEDAARATREAI